jgi:hypothetical protein
VNFLLLHQGDEEIVIGVEHIASLTRTHSGGTHVAVANADGAWESVDESPETIVRMIRAIGGNVQEEQPPDAFAEFQSRG